MAIHIAKIYCCECKKKVNALRVTGREIYPRRADLFRLKFYQCQYCLNAVGTHRHPPFKPLGVIPTKELKFARMKIHELLDPLWKDGYIDRTKLYEMLSNEFGYEYHTAQIKSIQEAREVYRFVRDISRDLMCDD